MRIQITAHTRATEAQQTHSRRHNPTRIHRTLCAALLIPWLVSTALASDAAHFLNPPGALWGTLAETNFTVSSVAATPDGAVVAGGWSTPPATEFDSWTVLARVQGEPGVVTIMTNYFDDPDYNRAYDIVPLLSGSDTLEGFAFVGMKYRADVDPIDPNIDWGGAKLWLVKTDPQFVREWEALEGPYDEWLEGAALVADDSGFVIGGTHAYLAGGGRRGLTARFDSSGNLIGELLSTSQDYVRDLIPAAEGGYVLATDRGIVKLNAALELEWTAGETPVDPDSFVDSYSAVTRNAAGEYVGLAHRRTSTPEATNTLGLVLTACNASGDVTWSILHPESSGTDFVPTPDGGFLVLDTRDNGLLGGSDLRLTKYTSGGFSDWQYNLGGNGNDTASGIAIAPDGNYLIAGKADVDGTDRLWVVKIGGSFLPPTASFTFTPASPVFRGQEITFDASGSTAPGSEIGSYHWTFGDGYSGTGRIITHTYVEAGDYLVTLEVLTTNNVSRAVSQEVSVIGLALQWERFYGSYWQENGNAMVQTRDGGFMITGSKDSSAVEQNRLWLLKTDRRGRVVWEQFHNGPFQGTETGRSIITAPDSGYVIAGDYEYLNGSWDQDALLMKVDELGEPIWPMTFFGSPGESESAACISAVDGGGYIMLGTAPTNTISSPWLLRLDDSGAVTWERHYPTQYGRSGIWTTPVADQGFAFIAEGHARSHLVLGTDALGIPVWTNSFVQYDRLRWIGEQGAPHDGLALLGESNENISFRFLNSGGDIVDGRSWTGPSPTQENDQGNYAARTPDGGYLIVGTSKIRTTLPWPPVHDDVALVKTDADGNAEWLQFEPGTAEIHEQGLAAVALSDNTFVILARRDVGDSRIWLFKLAPNHPPVPQLLTSTSVSRVGKFVTFDGSGSTDRDGAIAAHEWDFGDGHTDEGSLLSYAYTNSGTYRVTLTAVDDLDAERSVTVTNYVSGVREESNGFDILNSSLTNCPACDPGNYLIDPAPLWVDWDDANGFYLEAIATSSSTKTIRVTFEHPIVPGTPLYRLPDWTEVSYTVLDDYTVELQMWLPGGNLDLTFVMAETAPLPVINDLVFSEGNRISLSVQTEAGFDYQIQRATQLVPSDWATIPHALAPDDPADLYILNGSGEVETLFIDRTDSASEFFRVSMEPAGG